MNLAHKLMVLNFLFISVVVGQLKKGDNCQMRNGKPGVCKLITECQEAIDDLIKGITSQRCGFEGRHVVVCCENKDQPITTLKPAISPTQGTAVTTKPNQTSITKPNIALSASRKPGEICNQKCEEYTQYVFERTPDSIACFMRPGNIVRNECPFDRQELILGGDSASRKEFPHMAQLGFDGPEGQVWICGGSLISERFVLTAAHCLLDRYLGKAKYVRMGMVDLDDDDHKQEFKIIERIPYPEYLPPNYYHDIGLVKLDKDAQLNSFVRPACLYTSSSSPWSKVIASGWGLTQWAGTENRQLHRILLELYGQPTCNRTYRTEPKIRLPNGVKNEIMICAGDSRELRDTETCQGDSGGPLQVYRDIKGQRCMYDIIGVTSFGKACGLTPNVPSIYTRVSYYVKWIEDIVWPQTS